MNNHLGLMLLALVLVVPACMKKDQERHERKNRHEKREHRHMRNPQCRGDNELHHHDRKCMGTNEGAVKEHHKHVKHHEKKNHMTKKHEHKHHEKKHHAHHMKEEVVMIDEEEPMDEEMMGS